MLRSARNEAFWFLGVWMCLSICLFGCDIGVLQVYMNMCICKRSIYKTDLKPRFAPNHSTLQLQRDVFDDGHFARIFVDQRIH